MNTPATVSVIVSLRYLAGALLAGPVFILVAMSFVLAPTAGGPVPWLMISLVALLGVVCALLLPTIGYRLPALQPGAGGDVGRQARLAFTNAMVRRFALAYVVAVVSIGLGFVVPDGGIYVIVVGVLIGVALAGYHVWPSERVVSRSEQALEANGVDSQLRESLGMTPRPPGFLA